MRVLMMLVFLVVSGSAWADALKVKVKAKKNSHEHRRDGHDNRAEWDWQRPSWSLFYSNKSPHYRHKRHTGNNRSRSHYSGNRGHDRQWRNWRSADQFRTRRSNKSEPVIYINAEVSAISLRGIKRHAAIYDVYAELGDGRRIPLRSLEGSLHRGESFTRHFKESRYVTKLFLHVGPEYRHQRAYVSVDYLPTKNRGKRGFNNSPERGFNNSPERGFNNSPERGFNNSPERGFNNSPERG
ncbi:MAG: hypothetical protein HOD26_20195, partial [Gammaproteobacteria bacterium]|nr:hypothetical protein [Gammaproteobacteria bacterium]